MQLTVTCIMFAGLCAHAYAYSQTVSLSVKDMPLQKVFNEIKKQTGYSFAYFENDLSKAKKVSIEITNANLTEVLQRIFNDQPLAYTIVDKVIVVKFKAEKKIVVNGDYNISAPPIDIKGRVVNEKGDPIAGATITVKGTKTATATNGDGEFELKKVDGMATLVITGVNVETHEIPVSGRREVILAVKGKTGKLDEVQVIAYGKTSQRYNVGNITSVKAEDLEKQPVNNPLLALEGRVAGLFITQNSGLNGGSITVRIQGQNSIAQGSDPFYVIDGVPYYRNLSSNGFNASYDITGGGNPLNYINVNDIESIDILKDADATSIYGSRAANGAILITTKKGKLGKAKMDLNIQRGLGKVTRNIDMMGRREYLDMRYQALKNDGLIPTDLTGQSSLYSYAPDLTIWDTTRYTNWQKELIGQTANYTNINFSLSGGTPMCQYLIGGTYNKTTDVFPGDFANKSGALHFNLNSTSADRKFKIQFSGNYIAADNRLPGVDLTNIAIQMEPVAPSLFLGDTLNWAPNKAGLETWDNPLQYTLYQNSKNVTKNLISNVLIGYTLLPGLEIKSSFGYTQLNARSHTEFPLLSEQPSLRPNFIRKASFNYTSLSTYLIEPQISYQRSLAGGNLELLAGGTIQSNSNEVTSIEGTGYASDLLLGGFTGATVSAVTSNSQYKYNALFGRISYNLKNKYLLNVNTRRDGSSRFGSNNRFHNFGSIGLGWIFSEENFIKRSIPFLSFGKLKASYGVAGSDQIADYTYLTLYFGVSTPIPYQGATSLYAAGLPNSFLQWEETKKLQGGVDLGFFNDRALITFAYARNRSSNQLINYVLPSVTGFTTFLQNFPALVQNTSWELTLTTTNIQRRDLKWTSSFNITVPRNKLVEFPGIENSSYKNPILGVIVGQALGTKALYKYAGVDPATGQYLVLDKSGNPTANPTPTTDQTMYLNTNPRYYGGFQNSITYKAFQLDFLFQFVRQLGQNELYFYNGLITPGRFVPGQSNQPLSLLKHWQKPGDNALVEKYSTRASSSYATASDAYYSLDASYVRLKNVSVSYSIPTSLIKKLHIQNARVYAQGQNLLTFTKFSGLDPENQSSTSLPPLRILTIGVQLTL